MTSHTGETEPLLGNAPTEGAQNKFPILRDLSHLEDADLPDEQSSMLFFLQKKRLILKTMPP